MIFKCATCGSTNVGLDISINPNVHNTIRNECIANITDSEEGWCDKCGEHCQIIKVDPEIDYVSHETDLFSDWQQSRQDMFLLYIHDYNASTQTAGITRYIFYALHRALEFFSQYAESEQKASDEHFIHFKIYDCEIPRRNRLQYENQQDFLEKVEIYKLRTTHYKTIVVCDALELVKKYLPNYESRKDVFRFRELRLFTDGVISLNEKISIDKAKEDCMQLGLNLYGEALEYCNQKCAEYFRNYFHQDSSESPKE